MKLKIAVLMGIGVICLFSYVTAQDESQITSFIYEEKEIGGEISIVRTPHTLEEKKKIDEEKINKILQDLQEQGMIQARQDVDPKALAAWHYYWEQLKLWEEYVRERILYTKPRFSVYDINFSEPVTIPNQLRDLHMFWQQQATEITEERKATVDNLKARLEARDLNRLEYWEWREEQKRELAEFAMEWEKRLKGEEVVIEGNVYLISARPLKRVPHNAVNIVTTILTPYDLLNDDGTLKSPKTE